MARKIETYIKLQVPAGTDPQVMAEVRNHAAARLAGHMVPASLTLLDQVPLTPVGKLDRAALPEPVFTTTAGRAPRTEPERLVARVIEELVGVSEVSATDSFFDVGGNSLSAMRVVARAGEALGVELSVRDLFDAPSVRELVATSGDRGHVDRAREHAASRALRRRAGQGAPFGDERATDDDDRMRPEHGRYRAASCLDARRSDHRSPAEHAPCRFCRRTSLAARCPHCWGYMD